MKLKTKITILLAMAVGAGIPCLAQYAVTYGANHPRPEDMLVRQEVEFMEPKGSGKNAVWDFRRLAMTGKAKHTFAMPSGGIQPGEDVKRYIQTIIDSEVKFSYCSVDSGRLIRGLENDYINTYNSGGNSLSLWEQECPSTRMEFSLPQVLLAYPLTFNDKSMEYFSGYGVCYDRLGVKLVGSVETEADACGKVVLPGNDTLTNVLRVKIVKTALEEIESSYRKKNGREVKIKGDSIAALLKLNRKDVRKTEIVRWYAEGYRYPVLETIYSYTLLDGKKSDETRRAYFHDPAQQEVDYLSDDPLNRAFMKSKQDQPAVRTPQLYEDETVLDIESFACNFYPNPVETDLMLDLYLPEQAPVKLNVYNLQGSLVYQSAKESPKGYSVGKIPMAGLQTGSYILHIVCGEKTVIEKIIKK